MPHDIGYIKCDPACVLCELGVGHEHHNGQVPITPCRPCFDGEHRDCQPTAPYWCNCPCGLTDD